MMFQMMICTFDQAQLRLNMVKVIVLEWMTAWPPLAAYSDPNSSLCQKGGDNSKPMLKYLS